MNKAEETYYKIEFAVTYGEKLPESISKRTYNKVVEMLKEANERNNHLLLHKMGYDENEHKRMSDLYSKMAELLDCIKIK